MASRRVARVAEQIQQEIASLLLFEARDPLLSEVTITNSKVSSDLRVARLYYLPTRSDADRDALAKALDRARSFLRRQLGQRLRLRHVPELHFHLDEVVEHGRRMEQVFSELRETEQPATGDDDEENADASSEPAESPDAPRGSTEE